MNANRVIIFIYKTYNLKITFQEVYFVCQIIRGNLNGSQQEPLPILTVAKELNVDAVEGFIYWSTGHAVESSRLNGKHKKTYYPAELFSGKQGNSTLNILIEKVIFLLNSL